MKKQESRSGSDGVCGIGIMLQTKYQSSLQRFISGKRCDRADSDQAVEPNIAWAKEMLREFDDPNFVLVRPEGVRDEDKCIANPNDTERIVENAGKNDEEWFLNIWRTYVKKKYRESINRWDNKTDIGSGDSSLFGNFCKNDK